MRYASKEFQSTSSARRTTHTPLADGLRHFDFNPRPPRGGRLSIRYGKNLLDVFQSTSSARRTTTHTPGNTGGEFISIHVLREEDDPANAGTGPAQRQISIHVLREEDDLQTRELVQRSGKFQSTSSARRTTTRPTRKNAGRGHFNPRPPRGGRPGRTRRRCARYVFQSTSSARRTTLLSPKTSLLY